MFSWRFWRSIVDADIGNPIFRRVSQTAKPARTSTRKRRFPLWLRLVIALALLACVIYAPALLVLILVIPTFMIALIVLAPLLLPLVVLLAGIYQLMEIISGIYREKHQNTYDLICASTQGTLNASLSFATGIVHRDFWFLPLRWGTLVSLRIGGAVFVSLCALSIWLFLTRSQALGIAQLRILLLTALLLLAYYSHFTQTLVLSLIIGLYTSSFDWFKRDATFVGCSLYIVLSAAPIVLAGLLLLAFERLILAPPPWMRLAAESAALLLIVLLREAAINVLWVALKRRLHASRRCGGSTR